MASLIECHKGLLDSSDQRSQVAEREFREITVRMDHSESLSLDDLSCLVLGEKTALVRCPRDQGFPPGIGEYGLRVVDEGAEERRDRIRILRTSSLQQDHSWFSCLASLSGHDLIAAVDERSQRVIRVRVEEAVRDRLCHSDEKLFSDREQEQTHEVGVIVREEVHCNCARIRRAYPLPVSRQGPQVSPE